MSHSRGGGSAPWADGIVTAGGGQDEPVRVVVAPDSVGAVSALDAAGAIAAGWPGERVDLVPLGEAGAGFAQAVADLVGGERRPLDDHLVVSTDELLVVGARAAVVPADAPVPARAGSGPLGRVLRQALEHRPRPGGRVLVDLTGQDVHDGGAGLLAELGTTADVDLTTGVAGLTGLGRLDLGPARRRLAGLELVGVSTDGELDRLLLGLRGITSIRGRAAGMDPEPMLAADAALQRMAELAGVADRPGAGANGGLGLAVLALGGRLTTGPRVGAELAGLTEPTGSDGGGALTARAGRLRGADLVVTGCTRYDFATRGGGVVAEVARLAAEALVPCVVLAGEVQIGAREMRAMGVESAYAVRESTSLTSPSAARLAPATADDLRALAVRVARSWHW